MRRFAAHAIASLGIAGGLVLGASALPASAITPSASGSITTLHTSLSPATLSPSDSTGGSTGGTSGGGLQTPPPAMPSGNRPCVVHADANDPNSPILAVIQSGQDGYVQSATGDNYHVTCVNGVGTVTESSVEPVSGNES
jgi:hypothetical protein